MKSLLKFYLMIFAPIVMILWLNKSGLINSTSFVFLLLIYTVVYRTYTDGKRLAGKGIILKKDIWKMIIPGKRIQHFVELYLK